MSSKDLIFSEDFRKYRKAQIREVAEFVNENLYNKGLDHVAGAMEMARRIIRLPEKLINDKDLIDDLNRVVQEDLTQLSVEIVREKLSG